MSLSIWLFDWIDLSVLGLLPIVQPVATAITVPLDERVRLVGAGKSHMMQEQI
jgi:hypothetical protein